MDAHLRQAIDTLNSDTALNASQKAIGFLDAFTAEWDGTTKLTGSLQVEVSKCFGFGCEYIRLGWILYRHYLEGAVKEQTIQDIRDGKCAISRAYRDYCDAMPVEKGSSRKRKRQGGRSRTPTTALSQAVRDLADRILMTLPSDGSGYTNNTLIRATGAGRQDYTKARDWLVMQHKVLKGPGQGGTLRLTAPRDEPTTAVMAGPPNLLSDVSALAPSGDVARLCDFVESAIDEARDLLRDQRQDKHLDRVIYHAHETLLGLSFALKRNIVDLGGAA